MDVNISISKCQSPKATQDNNAPVDYLHPVGNCKLGENKKLPIQPRQGDQGDLKTNMRGMRFDSGVADLEQVSPQIPMQEMPSHKFRPISTNKTYDYADSGYHQYEELPHARLQNNMNNQPQMSPDSVDSHSSNGTTVTSGVHSEADEGERQAQGGEERKRYNPLYDTMINTTPTIYSKVNSIAKARQDNAFQKQIRILKLAILFLLILSLSSFCLSLYLVISRNNNEAENLRHELSELESNYSAMTKQMKYLESIVAGNRSFEYINDLGEKVSNFENRTNKNITDLEYKLNLISESSDNQISMMYQNFSLSIGKFRVVVENELNNISKMKGPQGPQGVGNLTACYMSSVSSGSKASLTQTATDYEPSDDVLKDKVVMFATCSVDGGQYSNLKLLSQSGNSIKYSCVCYGSISGVIDRICRLHLWLCPRETS